MENSLRTHTLMETGMSWADFPSAPSLCSPESDCVCQSLCTPGDRTCINKYNSFLRGRSCWDVHPHVSKCWGGSASSAFVKINMAMKILPLT